jgi:hypothetical protein
MSRVQKSSKLKTKKANQKPTEPAAGRSLIGKPESAAVAPSVNAPNAARAKKPVYSESGQLNERRLAEMAAEHHPTDEPLDIDRLARVFGTLDRDFTGSFIQQLIAASKSLNFNALSFIMALVRNVAPKDQLEALLAAHAAMTHIIMMTVMQRFVEAENLPQQQFAERSYIKLAHTYSSQMATLKRYRSGGEQKVTVQHVSISEGSQAIVGNVTRAAHDPALDRPANTPTALPGASGVAKSIFDMTAREIADLRRREEVDLKRREEEELRRVEEADGRYTDLPDAP